jgi:hypothetical protein
MVMCSPHPAQVTLPLLAGYVGRRKQSAVSTFCDGKEETQIVQCTYMYYLPRSAGILPAHDEGLMSQLNFLIFITGSKSERINNVPFEFSGFVGGVPITF